jgi:hypothetical protein
MITSVAELEPEPQGKEPHHFVGAGTGVITQCRSRSDGSGSKLYVHHRRIFISSFFKFTFTVKPFHSYKYSGIGARARAA